MPSLNSTCVPIRSSKPGWTRYGRFSGTQTESNHRLIKTCACPSPQKWRAEGLLAASRSHLCTASFVSPHSITNQWMGFEDMIPQISHLNSFSVAIVQLA